MPYTKTTQRKIKDLSIANAFENAMKNLNNSQIKTKGNYILEMFDYVRCYGYDIDYSYFSLLVENFNKKYKNSSFLFFKRLSAKKMEVIKNNQEEFLFYVLLLYVLKKENNNYLKKLIKNKLVYSMRELFKEIMIRKNINFGSQILDYIDNKKLDLNKIYKLNLDNLFLDFIESPVNLNLLNDFIKKTSIKESFLSNEFKKQESSCLNKDLNITYLIIVKLTVEIIVSRDRLDYGENNNISTFKKIISKINKKDIDFNLYY